MALGQLVVFRKGKTSAPYELDEGEHSIGSSLDSNIRLKFSHPLLLETHALIRVNSNGVATIINKSVGAPVRINGKLALKPAILKHEDKFEILEKIFQYFNENLKDEPEDSGKFVKEQKNILAKSRQSVHPVVKTPAKKSPNLKTKISSMRKSMSAVARSSKGLQVIITPNKKPDRRIGSKTTSKIIVSKALVSPRTAKKRRLSLDNGNKAPTSSKISSRNILLSKSTINITISEEHEYSEITPSTHEEGRTRKSIKLENTDTPNKNISVDLIDFNSPDSGAVNSPRRGRHSIRRTSLPHQSTMDTLANENTLNVMKTPINKRIQSLKTVRHSLKKDTPPPKLTIPKMRNTPHDKKSTDVSVTGDNDDISISYSPNAEPSSQNFTLKESKTPRRSMARKYEETGTPGNKSRVSFAEAPTEASLINLKSLNKSDHSIDKDNSRSPRKSRGNISFVNEESSARDMLPAVRRLTKSTQSLATTEDIEQDLELPKSRRSSRYSLNSTKKLGDSLLEVRHEKAIIESLQNETKKSRGSKRYSKANVVVPDTDEEQDNLMRKSFRNIIISASTDDSDAERRSLSRKNEQGNLLLTKSKYEDFAGDKSVSQSPKKAPNSRNTSLTGANIQNDSFRSETDMLAEPLHDSSADEMDELQILNLSDVEENSSNAKEKSLNTSKNISTRNSSALKNSGKSSRVSNNGPRTSNNPNKSGLDISQTTKLEESTTISYDGPDSVNNVSRPSRSSRNTFRKSTKQTEDIEEVHSSSRLSRNVSITSEVTEGLADFSQTEDVNTDIEKNVNKSSRFSRNASRRTSKIELAADYSQTDNKTTDEEDNVNNSFRETRKAPADTSQTEINDTDEEIIANKSSRVSRNLSRRSIKVEALSNSSQTESSITDERENVNKSSRSFRNASRRTSKIELAADYSQTDDETTDEEDNVNNSFRATRKAPADTSQTEINDTDEGIVANKSSRVSRNLSRRSIKVEALSNSSQTESSFTDESENVNKPSRASRNASKRASKIEVLTDYSQTDDKTTDEEDNVNKSSRSSRNASRRSTKIQESADSCQTEDNTTDVEEKDNKSRVSRNMSRRSNNLEELSSSLLTEDNSKFVEKSFNKSIRLSKNMLGIANISAVQEGSAKTSHTSSGNVSRRSARALNTQSSIDSAETTMDVQKENEEEINVSNSAKNRSRQRLSVFDESTQEAKPKTNISTNRSKQRVSIFDESTKEVDTSNSTKPISILDDTQEVLSPVRPLSPRKSIRNIQNQDLEGSISRSTRLSSIRKSRTKNQTLQDSSLTSTSMDQSSSSVISVSSQSFSSFKRASSRREETNSDTEIDVVNISSTMESTEVKEGFRVSDSKVTSKVLEENNTSRSSKRQTRTSEMFKDVSCTSTPFHKNISKRSDASGSKNKTKSSRASSSAILDLKSVDLMSVSNNSVFNLVSTSDSNNSVFMDSTEKSRSNSNVVEPSETFRRSSSRRSSVSKHAGEHNCISCNNSSVKRSRSLSATVEPSVVEKTLSAISRRSKTPKRSAGAVLEPSSEVTSPVKTLSSGMSSNMTTPLLHRKSFVTSEKTPDKAPDPEDETPKSSIKPARRSSKANQSAYNPLLEDITPVTPEKLMVSGFIEDVFKTPINTPGLFENIRKSVIRSRKRHRESTGSAMKDSKRARVDFTRDEQLETSVEAQQHKPQKSPVNRLSNFEGVKRLMRTPPKSPKNDLANVTGVKEMFSSPTEQPESPKKNLSNIPDLVRLVSPKRRTTPRKDLPQIPDLKRIMSPKQKNSPKSNLRSSVGGKQRVQTPKVQKEPVNDPTNITGVSNIFNVSGVEVLHQGSDIENSADLFTQLTGKRPVKAYPRGKSLSPNKTQQEQAHSRKTMGDIPVCSPRVQQWVEDHANVMYTSIDSIPVTPQKEDVLINVSEKPKLRSKSGRSVSPKKHLQEKIERRKTQGDALGDGPNAAAWKAERAMQAKTRKLSASRQTVVKAEMLSPNPVQTLQLSGTIGEKVTPQQLKSKTEILTPQQQMTPLVDTVTHDSIKTERRPRKNVVEEQAVTPQQSVERSLKKKIIENNTPASVKAKRGRPKKEIDYQQKEKQAVTPEPRKSAEMTLDKQMSEGITPASVKSKRGRPRKEIDDQQKKDFQLLTEEKSTPHIQITTSDNVTSPASVKGKKGRAKKVAAEKISNKTEPVISSSTQNNTAEVVTQHEPPQQVSETPNENENNTLKVIRRGGRSKRILSNEELDIVSSTTASPAQQPLTKRNKTRRGKIDSQSEPILEDIELKIAPTSRTRRAQKPSDTEPIAELVVKKPTRGRPRKNKIDDSETVSASPVRKGGRREKKDIEMETEPIKNDKKDIVSMKNEDPHKPAPKGRLVKKNVEKKPAENTESVEEIPEVKIAASKGKRGQKMAEENQIDIIAQSQIDTKKLPSGRRGKKVELVECTANIDEIPEPEVSKVALKGRRGKKEEEPEIKPTRSRKGTKTVDICDHIEEPVIVIKSTRSRKGKKAEESEKKETQSKVKEVKLGGRGQKNLILDEETDDSTDTEVEFNKRPTRGRANKGESQAESADVVPETTSRARKGTKVVVEKPEKPTKKGGKAAKTEEKSEVVESPKKPPIKHRGKKVTEPQPPEDQAESQSLQKPITRKLRNKVIEEIIEMDVDSPRTARAKRGMNKKYSTDEYEITEKKGGSKRKVHFEEEDAKTVEVDTRKSKRTRK